MAQRSDGKSESMEANEQAELLRRAEEIPGVSELLAAYDSAESAYTASTAALETPVVEFQTSTNGAVDR